MSRILSSSFSSVLARREVHETTTFLFVTLPNIHRLKVFFTYRLSNKPFLIWLLTCNLSLMACFADINVSQGSVATYARCDGILKIRLTANLLRNLPVIFLNRLRFDRIMVMSLWSRFSCPPCSYWRCVVRNKSIYCRATLIPDAEMLRLQFR